VHGRRRRHQCTGVPDEIRGSAEGITAVRAVTDLVAALHEADLTVRPPRPSIMNQRPGSVSRTANSGSQSAIVCFS
jgi:hypothetical protein